MTGQRVSQHLSVHHDSDDDGYDGLHSYIVFRLSKYIICLVVRLHYIKY